MSSRPETIGPVFQHRRVHFLPESSLAAMMAAARAHPGGFEFDGKRWRVVDDEDLYDVPDAYTVVGPGGEKIHVAPLGNVSPSPDAKRDALAAAAERRARAWDERIARSKRKRS